jgi:thioredoxin-related protein
MEMQAKMKHLFPLMAALLYLLPQTLLAEVGDDGLHKQPWFHQSFLELADDVQEAADEGKFLVVLIEQAGCPYCRELHEVNFKRSEITDYLNEHALVLQLDLWGAREVIDFDGEAVEERDWIQSQGIHFTPTTLIYTRNAEGAAKEAFRLPGYAVTTIWDVIIGSLGNRTWIEERPTGKSACYEWGRKNYISARNSQ